MKSEADIGEWLRRASEGVPVDDPPLDRVVRRGRRRIAIRLAATGVATSLVVGGLVAGLVSVAHVGRHGERPAGPVAKAIQRVDVFGRPIRRPVVAYGAFWTIVQRPERGDLILVRVDGRTLSPRPVAGLESPQAIAAGFDSIWVATCPTQRANGDCAQGAVLRLDGSGRISARIPTGPGLLYPIAAGEGAVWVERERSPGELLVVQIDPAANAIAHVVNLAEMLPHQLSCCQGEISPGDGAVWLMAGDRLARLDPMTLEVRLTAVSGDLMAAGAGAVWVNTSRFRAAPILRVDPATGNIAASIDGPGFGYPAIGDGSVWLAVAPLTHTGSISLYRIHPGSNTIERVLSFPLGTAKSSVLGIGGPVENVAVGEGAVWITDEDAHQVIRVDLRALEGQTASPSP